MKCFECGDVGHKHPCPHKEQWVCAVYSAVAATTAPHVLVDPTKPVIVSMVAAAPAVEDIAGTVLPGGNTCFSSFRLIVQTDVVNNF